MDEFRGRVAVITGAARGIGRGIAERCAQEGMKVVLAGINEDNLISVENELRANGTEVLSVRAGVSKLSDIETLAQTTGVIYAAKIFVPIMLTQDTESHIVNTSSIAGVLPYHPSAPYQVTKHAVVALTENLHFSLIARNAKVSVSVLCPGWVKERILESGRNRPPSLRNEPVEANPEQ